MSNNFKPHIVLVYSTQEYECKNWLINTLGRSDFNPHATWSFGGWSELNKVRTSIFRFKHEKDAVLTKLMFGTIT